MTTTAVAPESRFFVTGGTLARDAASYVVRAADEVLFTALQEGRFCYVLTARQMGKSSLMVRTAARLRATSGVVVLDLTAIGQNLTAEQWYDGLLARVGEQLELEAELEAFWQMHGRLGPLQRWMAAFREVVLPRYPGPLVVFIDEIDTVRSLPFATDEFFAAIREFYNRRSEEPDLRRLTFCLLGVATASDLIRDTRTTPFNIGQRIELHDFTPSEAAPLADGLGLHRARRELLDRILYWTGGHPYLTQRLCQTVADGGLTNVAAIDGACAELFFTPRAQERDDNLLFVRERLLRSEVDVAALLTLFRQVLRGRKVIDDETDPLVSVLRLSGVVRVDDDGRLRVRNRIYARVFNEPWVLATMPDAELRRQRAAYVKGLVRASVLAAVIVLVISILAGWAVRQRNRAQAEAQRADAHRREAIASAEQTARAAAVADARRVEAEAQRREADAQRQEADAQRQEADIQRALVQQQEITNRRLLYASDMKVAGQAWIDASINRVEALLVRHSPKTNEEDPRGFEWFYLWRSIHSSLATFRYAGQVFFLAFLPDNKTVAVGGSGRTVEIREASTGRLLRSLQAPHEPNSPATLGVSPSGNTIATATKDGWLRLWAVDSGRPVGAFEAQKGGVSSLAFSPDGTKLATGGDGLIRLWELETGRELMALSGHLGPVTTLSFSRDGGRLASASPGPPSAHGPYEARVWDLTTGKFQTLQGHSNIVTEVEFSPDGSTVVTGGGDYTARIWDASTGKQRASLGHADGIPNVAFSPDGRLLATACADRLIRIWDIATVPASPRLVRQFKGHSIFAGGVAFSSDGERLVSGDTEGLVRIWSTAPETPSAPQNFSVQMFLLQARVSPDGRLVVAVTRSGELIVQNLETSAVVTRVNAHEGGAYSVAVSPDNAVVATSGGDKTIKLWSTRDWKPIRTLSADANDLAFSPDGRFLASAGQDGRMKLWNPRDGREVAVLHEGAAPVIAVAFGRGDRLAHGDEKGEVSIWDLRRRVALARMSTHKVPTRALKFSPDGKQLATGGSEGQIRIWNAENGRALFALEGHGSAILSLDFSPDGRRLASGSYDKTVRLWDLSSREELITLRGHTNQVYSVQFFSKGRGLMSAAPLGPIRFWLSASPEEVRAREAAMLRARP